MLRVALIVSTSVALAACGGKGKKEDTGPEEDNGGGGAVVDDPGSDGMTPPDKLDQIRNLLDRKRNTASRCVEQAIDGGDPMKSTTGKVTLQFVIARSGHARDISVVRASATSERLQSCLVDLVSKISFPEIPQDLDWSYTFAFEAF
jgi:hypothetical protein